MPFRRTAGVTFEMSGDRVVILDAEGSAMTTVNPVGSMIWQSLDGECDTKALALHLGDTFPDVDEATLTADVDEFLASMLAAGLISEA